MSIELVFMSDLQRGRLPDDGPGSSCWEAILERTFRGADDVSYGESLLLLGGDLINMGDGAEEMSDIIRRVRDLAGSRVVLPCPGNSDWKEYDIACRQFDLPHNGPAGYEDRFYSYEQGPCHIMVLDSNLMGNRSKGWIEMLQGWIRSDLENTTCPAIVVMMHHPMWLPGYGEDDQAKAIHMRKEYLPLFMEYGVDLILCGHQHLYARRDPKAPGEPTQIMAVSGNKFFPARDREGFDVVVENTSTAIIARVDESEMEIRAIDEDGNEIDHVRRPIGLRGSAGDTVSIKEESDDVRRTEVDRQSADCIQPGSGSDSLLIRIYGKEICRLTEDEVSDLPGHRVAYSVFRRGGLRREEKEGVLLEDVLAKAGWSREEAKPGDCLCFTSAEGLTRTVILSDLFRGHSYADHEDVPPMLSFERDDRAVCGLRLVTGQTGPEEHNGCKWIRNVVTLDIVDAGDLSGYRF